MVSAMDLVTAKESPVVPPTDQPMLVQQPKASAHHSNTYQDKYSPHVCAHCQNPVPQALQGPSDQPSFCCSGCEKVFYLLQDWGLDSFYQQQRNTLGVTRSDALQPPPSDIDAVAVAYDSDAFAERFIQRLPDGSAEIYWAVGGLHCAACVWLLERLPHLHAGIIQSRTNFADNTLRLQYWPEQITPSQQAVAVAQLGYRVSPPHEVSRQQLFRREKRQLVVTYRAQWCRRYGYDAFGSQSAGGGADPVDES